MNGLLFIDDEEGVRRSVVRALKRETYPTYAVENGEEGIAFLKNNISSIATVISDYKMPGLNGLESKAICFIQDFFILFAVTSIIIKIISL